MHLYNGKTFQRCIGLIGMVLHVLIPPKRITQVYTIICLASNRLIYITEYKAYLIFIISSQQLFNKTNMKMLILSSIQ